MLVSFLLLALLYTKAQGFSPSISTRTLALHPLKELELGRYPVWKVSKTKKCQVDFLLLIGIVAHDV